jgi:hypothetical protein
MKGRLLAYCADDVLTRRMFGEGLARWAPAGAIVDWPFGKSSNGFDHNQSGIEGFANAYGVGARPTDDQPSDEIF